jgi:uncharacterized protein (TIGR03437 family)
VNADGTISVPATVTTLGPSRPSKPGDVIVIYCTGLGQTTPSATTGAPASFSPVQSIANVAVTFGGQVSAQSVFAGLTPGTVGLYQVNVQLPSNVPIGTAVSLSFTMGTSVSNAAYIDIVPN